MAQKKKVVARKSPRKEEVPAAPPPAKPQVAVDFPQDGELVTSPSYGIRISAPEGSQAEVSIDDGPWQACRFSVGYWWYDWSGYAPGIHRVQARAHQPEAGAVNSWPRQFTARLG